MEIILRSGEKAEFDRNRITRAIKKALEACDMPSDTIALSVTEDVVSAIGAVDSVEQEHVQDLIEDMLMKRGLLKVAKAFIKYRDRHAMIRNTNTELINGVMDKASVKVDDKDNANVDGNSFGGRMGAVGAFMAKKLSLWFKVSDITRSNHENNMVYIHDLDQVLYGSHNCIQIPFDQLLANGFDTRQTDVRSPQSINTAFQLMAVIFQLQSLQQFGGVGATHCDATMVPYVRKSFKKHYLKRAMEEYMHDRILQDKKLSEEMDVILWRFPNKTNWYAVDDEHLETIEKTFNKWYMEVMDLTDEDFRFYNTKLDPSLRSYAMRDTRKETYQAVEAFIHNMNTLQSRSGNQLPFSSINLGTCTEPEGRLVTELMLRIYIKGTGASGRTPIFPCFIFVLKDGINKKQGDPNYDLFQLAVECTAKRLYPNYANGDWSTQIEGLKQDREMKRRVLSELTDEEKSILINKLADKPDLAYRLTIIITNDKLEIDDTERYTEQMSTMGCRSMTGYDLWAEDSYREAIHEVIATGDTSVDVLSAVQKDGRGNICPTTLILPELAFMSNGDVETFMQILENKIEEAKDSLIDRYNLICSQSPKAAPFMYGNHTMVGYVPEEGIKSALRHGTLAIGQLGLAEALQILIGKDHTTEEGMKLAVRIEELFSAKVKEFRKKYKLNFGVYYSPAESLCHTAMKKFQSDHGKLPNISDREYFTNSMHVPVTKRMSAFEKLDIESKLTGYSTAGCITYDELDLAVKNNPEGLEKLILYAMSKDIPYLGLNLPNDQCIDCGHLGDIPGSCPKCGSNAIMRLRRVTGYLSSDYHHFNLGKQDEVEHRVKHIG